MLLRAMVGGATKVFRRCYRRQPTVLPAAVKTTTMLTVQLKGISVMLPSKDDDAPMVVRRCSHEQTSMLPLADGDATMSNETFMGK